MSPPAQCPKKSTLPPHLLLPLLWSLLSSSGYSCLPIQFPTPPRPRPLTLESLSRASLLVEVTKLRNQGPDFFSPHATQPASESSHLYESRTGPRPLDPWAPEFIPPLPNHMMTPEEMDWLMGKSELEWDLLQKRVYLWLTLLLENVT